MWIGDDHVGQLLDIPQTVCKTVSMTNVSSLIVLIFFQVPSHRITGHTESVARSAHSSPS
jgi:hypothetical protein